MVRLLTSAARVTVRQPARAWLIARMAGWVMILSALVKFCPLSRALRVVSPNARRTATLNDEQIEKLSKAIDALLETNVMIFRPSCWKRATVLHRYLALAGVATTIQFGVKRDPEGQLKGHAWLEAEGRPILESEPPVYKVTYSFPSADDFEGELAIMTTAER